jgi:hypothetical protein
MFVAVEMSLAPVGAEGDGCLILNLMGEFADLPLSLPALEPGANGRPQRRLD